MRFAVLLFFLACAVPAVGQWNRNSEPIADSADRKSSKGFGAHLAIIEHPKDFIEEWKKPQTPKFDLASKAKRGELYGVFVFFFGCRPDDAGACNSEVDYVITKPDGTPYAEQPKQPLWKDRAPPAPNIQMGLAILVIRFEKTDPAGEYKVKATVRDLNASISLELETRITLQK